MGGGWGGGGDPGCSTWTVTCVRQYLPCNYDVYTYLWPDKCTWWECARTIIAFVLCVPVWIIELMAPQDASTCWAALNGQPYPCTSGGV